MSSRHARRSRRSRTQRVCCVVCGVRDDVELHHVGGRHHVSWFMVPLCQKHHREVTRLLQEAGVEMRAASTNAERIGHALQAMAVMQWWLGKELLTS